MTEGLRPRSRLVVPLTRREFLRRTAAAAITIPATGSLLAACASTLDLGDNMSADALKLPRPGDPVEWAITPENPAIPSGLEPETGVVLRLLNWDQYIAPDVLTGFEERYGCKIEVSTFYDLNLGVAKLRSGGVRADVFFPSPDVVGRLIYSSELLPLNHDYLPNLKSNVWKQLQSPFYDVGSRYTVPYAIYNTGIGWRNDLVTEDVAAMENPYDIFFDEKYMGKVYILNDMREAMSMMLLRNGITDLNTANQEYITRAKDDLLELLDVVSIKWSLDDYTLLAEGGAWIHQAWSGDIISAPYYGPPGKPRDFAPSLSYWFPPNNKGPVGNDNMVIPAASESPVLAHLFLNYILSEEIAVQNFTWLGYQQPVYSLTKEAIERPFSWLGEPNFRDAILDEKQLKEGLRELELSPEADTLWQLAWAGFRAGG